jgi:hypothetical protein
MTALQLAETECARWYKGNCGTGDDKCKIGLRQPCKYFEECLVPLPDHIATGRRAEIDNWVDSMREGIDEYETTRRDMERESIDGITGSDQESDDTHPIGEGSSIQEIGRSQSVSRQRRPILCRERT